MKNNKANRAEKMSSFTEKKKGKKYYSKYVVDFMS